MVINKSIFPIIRITFLCFLALFAVINNSYALKFYPFREQFYPSGVESNKLFFAENETDEEIAVQINMSTFELDENGEETNKQTDNFSIYPQQIILQPKQRKAIRVQWVGNKDMKIEESYRIIAEQLPVNLDKGAKSKNEIKWIVTYRGMVFVTPQNAFNDLFFSYSQVKKNNKNYLQLIFENNGTKHLRLNNSKLTIVYENGKSVIINAEDKILKDLEKSLILAQNKRSFFITPPTNSSKIKNVKFDSDKNI